MEPIRDYFTRAFERALARVPAPGRRIGAELKFPLVGEDGEAVDYEIVRALWAYLGERGWKPVRDAMTKAVIGAREPGQFNDTVASCETGYCKTEFSLAHVSNLFALEAAVASLRRVLRPFAEQNRVCFLGYGIHPMTSPGRRLLMKKGRAGVFDKVLRANRRIPEQEGHDVHLFTINAASHVHISTSPGQAVDLVNVLNGFSGAQIALTADSSVWKGRVDPDYKCVAEKFWDWWMPESERVGVPERPFQNLEDYVQRICGFRPIYVKREGRPLILEEYSSFEEYFMKERARGVDLDGRAVSFTPAEEDMDLHCSCYWHNARISRYYTVENRVNDQQPPADLMCAPALTLGLAEAAGEAWEELRAHEWSGLRAARDEACRHALAGRINGLALDDFARVLLELAELGLKRRGLGEEEFLSPLWERLEQKECPADEAARVFERGGIEALLSGRGL